MDTPERFKNWLKLMGYQGKIPNNFKRFCNPSTAIIWEQLIQTVKPKNEIVRIRNTLLINRCSSSESSIQQLQNESKHPIKEMELWNKKQSLKEKLLQGQEQLSEIGCNLDEITKANHLKYLKIETVRTQICQTRNRIYVLNRERRQLEEEISEVQELLTQACNLTPVESDTDDRPQVSDTLRQCTLRLEKMIESEPKRKPAEGRDSFGLLDETSFTCVLASSSFKETITSEISFGSSISNDLTLQDLIQSLFKYNRHCIWDNICKENEIQSRILIDNVMNALKQAEKEETPNCILPILYWAHIDFKLKMIQVRSNIAVLERKIGEMDNLCAKEKQNEFGLNRAIRHLHNFIDLLRNSGDDVNILKVKQDLMQVRRQISTVFEDTHIKRGMFKQVYKIVQQLRNDTSMLARKLGKFTLDSNWMQLLRNNVCSIEVGTFLNYPLEYCPTAKAPVNYQTCESYDSNMLQITLTLFPNIWSPPEVTLINIIRLKERLQLFKSSAYPFKAIGERDIPNFLEQESYINYAIDKLKSSIASKNSTSHTYKELHESLEIWMNMPLKKFISPKRIFNGFPYSHYEEMYDNFYKQL
ncbi:hypothetical protein RI129_002617 [Pyrocoelia pectoralis]|uniref:Uncharacterized protein n=1 Tax=Pyrocoelia pectoralis TaxID=417401 RepID=A0AAN7VFM8_9COLE